MHLSFICMSSILYIYMLLKHIRDTILFNEVGVFRFKRYLSNFKPIKKLKYLHRLFLSCNN